MGRVAKQMTAIEVGRLNTKGYHAVGTVPGLYLNVAESCARSWILRTVVGNKRREMGLGAYPAITLAAAHKAAREARESIRLGVDPVLKRKALVSALKAAQFNAMTFEVAAQAYIDSHKGSWRNAKHGAQWHATLAKYAYPVIGDLSCDDVKLPQVRAILEPIWMTTTVTAVRLRGRIEKVLDWAEVRGYRSGLNPARWKGYLDTLLAPPNKVKGEEHHPAVTINEVGRFMRDLRTHDGMGALALEFTLLTAARSGEVRGAVWEEVDLEAKVWTIPAGRMKAGKEHREPLSDAAVALLSRLPRMAESKFVFASPRGGALSDMTLSQLMKRMDYKARDGRTCVPHGLRSTFRDWAADRTNYPKEVVEAALAHANTDKVAAAYLRTDLMVKRSNLMAEWSEFLGKVESKSDTVAEMGK